MHEEENKIERLRIGQSHNPIRLNFIIIVRDFNMIFRAQHKNNRSLSWSFPFATRLYIYRLLYTVVLLPNVLVVGTLCFFRSHRFYCARLQCVLLTQADTRVNYRPKGKKK
jgi:hypothetical protein